MIQSFVIIRVLKFSAPARELSLSEFNVDEDLIVPSLIYQV